MISQSLQPDCELSAQQDTSENFRSDLLTTTPMKAQLLGLTKN